MLNPVWIKKYAYTPAIVWGILILYFSLLPSDDVPGQLKEMSDQLLHALIYGGLTLLLTLAVTVKKPEEFPFSTALLWLVFATLFGGLVEYLQETYIPGREGEWRDVLANFLGAICGLIIAFGCWRLFHKQWINFLKN
ncbi:MAG: VanZ family protein [Schleiferiaceae bacterium]|nr:VanZ family protein [Schleiferiaceae bacterium]